MNNDEAKLVASIAATSPIAFESAIETVSTPAEVVKDPPSDSDIDNPWEGAQVSRVAVEQPADPPPTDPPPEPSTDPLPADPPPNDPLPTGLEDYSEAAIAAKALQESHPSLFAELEKDLGWEKFIGGVDKYIAETLEAGKTYQLEEVGQAKQYVDFLLKGGNPETLRSAVRHTEVVNINLETAEEAALETVIRAEYQARDAEEDADYILESLKLKGKDALKARAGQSQTRLRERETKMLEDDERQRQAQDQQAETKRLKTVTDINTAIDQKEIMGYALDDQLRTELKDMIFKPSVIIDVEQDGKIVQQRVTEFAKLQREFTNSIEQQVAFALLLKRGFDLSKIIVEGQKEKDNSLLKELRRRGGASTIPKVTSGYLRE